MGMSLSLKVHQLMVQGRDGMQKYVLRHPMDPLGLNLLGLLYEQEGLVKPAEQVLRQSLSLVSPQHLPVVLTNHARLLRY